MLNVIYALLVLGILGALFGLVLSVASKIFEVKKDPRAEEILDLALPAELVVRESA